MRFSVLATVAAAALALASVTAQATAPSTPGASAPAASGSAPAGAAPRSGAAAPSGGATTTTTTTTGGGGGATINLSAEQRTQAVTTLRSVNVQPVTGVTLAVGQTVPTTVTQLVDCPTTLRSLITGVSDCKVVLVGDTYYIVEGGSRRVVTTIARQ